MKSSQRAYIVGYYVFDLPLAVFIGQEIVDALAPMDGVSPELRGDASLLGLDIQLFDQPSVFFEVLAHTLAERIGSTANRILC